MLKTCLLNVAIGRWYTTGQDRLRGSLTEHGFDGDVLAWKDEWPSNKYDRSCVYNVKPAAFEVAIARGYTNIIWADASVYAVRNTQRFLQKVREDGLWFGQSGYSSAQTASDMQIQHFGVSRDWAENVPDCATGLFGVNLENPQAAKVIDQWIKAGRSGAFIGSRKHGNQSHDPRFLFCRQDQSAMSLILGKEGVALKPFLSEVAFKWDADTGQTFRCEGM